MRKFGLTKGKIAAGSLAVLIAAGGTTGALITAQSTIQDNTVTVQGTQTPAEVVSSGTPITVTAIPGQDFAQQQGTWTLKNTGQKAATVKASLVTDAPGGVMPGKMDSLGQPRLNLAKGTKVDMASIFYQKDLTSASTNTNKAISIAPGEEITVTWSMESFKLAADSPSTVFTFDIAFDYVDAA